MTAIIIVFSVLFAAICIGVQILISKSNALAFCNYSDDGLNSFKWKFGSISILILYAYNLINNIISITKAYPADWTSGDLEEELGTAFAYIFSLLIIISYITLAIFLLKKLKKLAILSSATIIILSVFNSVFIKTINIQYSYFSLLPYIVVLLSLIVVIAATSGKSMIFYHYQKLFKLAPCFILLDILNIVITKLMLNRHFLSIDLFIDVIIIFLKFAAFYCIFNTLISSIKQSSELQNGNETISNKEKLILSLSILILPLFIWILSTISKVWLFVSLILLAIAVPIVIVATKDSATKTKVIALICTFSAVIGLCVIAKIAPKNNDEFDPYKCHWCDGYGFYVTEKGGKAKMCSHCNGTGERN